MKTSPKPHALNIFRNLILAALSLFLFLGGFELICRGFDLSRFFDADFKFFAHRVDDDMEIRYNTEDFLLLWRPRPNYDDGTIKINSAGFRGAEYPARKDSSVLRILCLGDSSTFGWESSASRIYPYLLENKLNAERASSHLKFEVINAGATGYTSAQGLALYKHVGVRYRPDIVTFYFGSNDPVKRFYMSDKQIMREDLPVWYRSLINNYLLRFDSYRLFRKLILTLRHGNEKKAGESVPRVSLRDFRNNIIELNRLCQQRGAVLVLISPPLCEKMSRAWSRTQDVLAYKKTLEDVANQYEVPLLKVPDMSEQSEKPNEQYFQNTMHPSDLGHERIALFLYDFLTQHHFL